METAAEDVPEGAADPSTTDILLWVTKIGYWILWPIGAAVSYLFYYISIALRYLLRLIVEPLLFVLAPIFYLGQFLWSCVLAPFRLLAKFETLYIYLAVAALTGIGGGVLLNLVFSSLQRPLGITRQQEPAGRTAKQYREEKRSQKVKAERTVSPAPQSHGNISVGYVSLSDGFRKGGKGRGLLAQTIMEEVDDSDY